MVIPVFFTLILGLVELGTGVLQTSQASGAAADGARVAIIWTAGADQPDVVGSASNQRVRAAVAARLLEHDFNYEVHCIGTGGAAVACSAAQPGTTRIRVKVSVPFRPLSFVGSTVANERKITSTAVMALIRLPQEIASNPTPPPTTAPPTTLPSDACQVTGLTASPLTIPLKGNNPTVVKSDVTFAAQTAGSCGVVTMTFDGAPLPGTVLAAGTDVAPGSHIVAVLVDGAWMASYSINAAK